MVDLPTGVHPTRGEYGEVVIQGHDWWPGVGWREIEILQADPRILIGGQMLDEIRGDTKDNSHAWLDRDLLTIKARNQTVVYRLIERSPDPNHHGAWVAEEFERYLTSTNT